MILIVQLLGHFNAFMLQILHCNISDPNAIYKVNDTTAEAVVPDLLMMEGAYPKCPGMLGDWGYAADLT